MKNKTKRQRQQWWKSLTLEQQSQQIEKWWAQKAIKRENMPLMAQDVVPGYPWLTESVNDTNKAQWMAMVLRKNPWLKVA